MPVPPGHELTSRQLAAVALVRADLEGRVDDVIDLANAADPVTTAALAHQFALVLAQSVPNPHALLDALTAVYTAAYTEEDPTP